MAFCGVLLGSFGFFWRSSGVLLVFFCVIEHQKNARRTPEEHQKNTRRTQKNPEGEEHQPPRKIERSAAALPLGISL